MSVELLTLKKTPADRIELNGAISIEKSLETRESARNYFSNKCNKKSELN